MRRKNIIVQFIQKGILILNDNKIEKYNLMSVDNYKIINKSLFIEELNEIITLENINKSILTNNVSIIIDNTYSSLDKVVIEQIFKELSFNKIDFLDIVKLFNLSNEEIIINMSNNNIKIYYLNEVIEQNIYFNKYSQYINILLKNILKSHQIKSIKLYGNNCNNKKLINQIEKITQLNVYIYSQSELYPILLLI